MSLTLQPRERFPQPVGSTVRCPNCSGDAVVEGDRVIWVCPCGAMGYYEQPEGVYFPRATYKRGDGSVAQA